jgi:hypothetical protein
MSRLASAAAIAAVLVLAALLFVSRGLVDALSMIALVAVLTGLYRLRHHARAEVLYRRRAEPHRADESITTYDVNDTVAVAHQPAGGTPSTTSDPLHREAS